MISLTKIGKTGGSQGRNGYIKIFAVEPYEQLLTDQEFLFLYLNGNKVPLKVHQFLVNSDPFLINFKGYNSPELAHNLVNKEVFIESKKIVSAPTGPDQTLMDFQIISSDAYEMGRVIAIENHPKQILLLVEKDTKTYRIPFHQDLILGVDQTKKCLYYQYSSEELQSMLELS